MPPHPNLISGSLLVKDTIAYLKSAGGMAPAVKVVDRIFRMRLADPKLARVLVSDLIDRDPRLGLDDDVVRLLTNNTNRLVLEETGFVVFDLETTGSKAPPCRVIEIGAFRVFGGKIVDEFQTLVDPEMPIPYFISGLTGITDDMVRGAPKFADVVGKFLDFIGDSVLVAHNAPFDLGFLDHEISRVFQDYRMGNPSLCTVQLARNLVPEVDNHKLKTLADYYSIELVNHHRAHEDARATARIFVSLLEKMGELGIRDLGGARKLARRKRKHAERSEAAA
jgi:DNA polymerase III epsilon subunit family exonuclease